MFFDLNRIRANVHQAETEDLLDRVTIWRSDVEEEALPLIEEELRRRDITTADVTAHEEARKRSILLLGNGLPSRCCKCFRPAVEEIVAWHRIWGLVPAFRRSFHYCAQHRPPTAAPSIAP
jgi:hypothetical protein